MDFSFFNLFEWFFICDISIFVKGFKVDFIVVIVIDRSFGDGLVLLFRYDFGGGFE